MTIVCGVDFSEASQGAAQAAAALAKLSRQPLILVHAGETGASSAGTVTAGELLATERARLEAEARALGEDGLLVDSVVAVGVPDEVLLDVARQYAAAWIVVGPWGHERHGVLRLGTHADRLAQRTMTPVLVTRDGARFESWARGERPLKVVLGLDHSPETSRATSWVAELTRLGACEVTAIHLYWPPSEWGRLGLSGIREILTPDPEVTQTLERDFDFCRSALASATRFELRVEPSLGSIGSRLAELAREESADLIVVGSRTRGVLRRWWEGAVSHAVLEFAQSSVVCVPGATEGAVKLAGANANSVLVATDFSAIGNSAIRFAYQTVGEDGTVHVVHVGSRSTGDALAPHDIFEETPNSAETTRRIAALLPEFLSVRIHTELHALSAVNIVDAICQAAERLGVGTIVLGTHGRTGLSRALLGSIAAGVLAKSKRRVVLVRPPAGPLSRTDEPQDVEPGDRT